MNENTIRDDIDGARNIKTIFTMFVLMGAGLGFFLAGLSSYLGVNLLLVTDTKEIAFIPQGIALLFYGTGGLSIFYALFF